VLDALLDDLEAEYGALDAIVRRLEREGWDVPTPAAGWAVRDQVFHLAFSEELATTALSDPAVFESQLGDLMTELEQLEERSLADARAAEPAELLERWRAARISTLAALRRADPSVRVRWITGAISAASFATARLMETWAHGQDIVDALGIDRRPTHRLRHIADLGVRTRAFSYAVRATAVPDVPVLVRLEAPDDTEWSWGPDDAADRILGPALDFCLVVTRRRHPGDTNLIADGGAAREWLAIAQAFAGPPSTGRLPGQFTGPAR
jgi:uncharacterized protein (TIGR03084 family)